MSAASTRAGGRQPAAESCAFLREHIVHKREIPNGMDFLFMGPAMEIHDALKQWVSVEQAENGFLQFDFAKIDDCYLLRVAGAAKYRQRIRAYFKNR